MNPDASLQSPTFTIERFTEIVNLEDISRILATQHNLLQKLEKTNAMLHTVTELSAERMAKLSGKLRSNTRLLISIKRELTIVLKRISLLKARFQTAFPDEYAAAVSKIDAEFEAELEASHEPILQPKPRMMGTLPEHICDNKS